MHTIVETPTFDSAAEAAGMTDNERHQLNVFLSQNPDAGELIVGTGGARKLRIPLKGKGKRGGGRVITYYAGEDVPVFLLDVYSKGEKINLSQKERNQLKELLAEIADAYRESTKKKTREIRSAS